MANKKVLLVVLVAFVAGWSFAQTDSETANFETTDSETTDSKSKSRDSAFLGMPKNTITVDIGPTIIGLGIGAVGRIMSAGAEGVSSTGFGIAAQYERQLLRKLSAAGRFAYMGGGVGFGTENAVLGIRLDSFSLEGHVRFYPSGRAFFLDGMLGYANLAVRFSGDFEVDVENYGKKTYATSLKASRSYFKLGGKLGWRIDFGRPGGFVFEPSLGYYGGIGGGDTIPKRLLSSLGVEGDVGSFDKVFKYVENFVFVGGPRLALSFGGRF